MVAPLTDPNKYVVYRYVRIVNDIDSIFLQEWFGCILYEYQEDHLFDSGNPHHFLYY